MNQIKMKVSEEEFKNPTKETIKKFADFLRILMEKKGSSLNEPSNPNEVRIVVSEDLGFGEKIGG